MAKADIGPKIGIEGEAQFRREIKQIDTELKTLGTEMQRVTSEFIGNERSVEALTAANDVLGAQSVELERKQALLRDQLQKAADAYGVADARTQALTQQYNKNEAQLNKTNAQIAANEAEIKQLTDAESQNTDETGKMTDAMSKFGTGAGGVDGVLKALGINVQGLTSHLGLSREQTEMLSSAFNGGGMSLAVAGAAAAGAIALAAKAVKEIIDFMREAVTVSSDYADNILTLSTNYHMATDTLQEYQYMAELTDTSLDTITGSVQKLTKSMSEARKTGTSKGFIEDGVINNAADAFRYLSIQVVGSDGKLRDATAVFEEAIKKLSMMSDDTERDAITMALFGKSAMELNSIIESMANGSFEKFRQEAHDINYVLSEQQLQTLHELDDEFERYKLEMEAVQKQIAAETAPALLDLAHALLDIAQSIDWQEFGQVAADAIRTLTPLIVDAAEAVANLVKTLGDLRDVWNNLGLGKLAKAGSSAALNYGLNSIPGVSQARELWSVLSGVSGLLGGGNGSSGRGGQININLNDQNVGSAFTTAIDGYAALRGKVL